MNTSRNNMKQFDLEEYKKNPNRKVITHDGKSVRIVCTDMIGTSYPVLAICRVNPTHDCYYSYTLNGKHNNVDSRLDLFFAPEKHEGWINLYKINSSISPGPLTYNTKKEAESATGNRPDYISTIKIEWEE